MSEEPKKRRTPALSGELKSGVTQVAPLFYGGIILEKLRIYRIRDGYIQFLHERDRRVQYNKGERRPYLGVVLEINGHQYFVPMESPKPNHANMKNGVHLMRIEGGKYGILGFNNMVPAKSFFLVQYDINKEPDEQYRNLLWNQLSFCNKHRSEIYEHARKTYEGVTVKKTPFLLRICCDFKLLEQEYVKYYFKTTES